MQIIRSSSTTPGFNLAAEEYIFSQRQDEILFLYVNSPCVVIGCNQALLSEADTDYCSAYHISLFRRMSGGGAVYHDEGNLNYCFVKNRIPGKFPLGAEFLHPIVEILETLEISVQLGARKDLWLPDGYKISGTASHVGKFRELHHGTLLYDSDLEKLQKALSPKPLENISRAIASVPGQVKNIRKFLSEQNLEAPDALTFFQQFTQKLLDFYDQKCLSFFTEKEMELIQRLKDNTYESVEWTFKK